MWLLFHMGPQLLVESLHMETPPQNPRQPEMRVGIRACVCVRAYRGGTHDLRAGKLHHQIRTWTSELFPPYCTVACLANCLFVTTWKAPF